MTQVHVGTMGWSYKFWLKNFYPESLDPREFLTEYSRHFNTVEVDSTFYRTPNKTTIARWKKQTRPGFMFSMKFPRKIAHVKRLRNCEEETKRFIDTVTQLEPKLGVLLLQLPPTFKQENLRLLEKFLQTLPKENRYGVEVRNPALLTNSLYSILHDNDAALALTDRTGFLGIDKVTADFTYIRWEGDRKVVNGTLGKIEVERTVDIKMWAQRIEALLETSVEVFGYFSKYYSGHPPTDVQQLLDSL